MSTRLVNRAAALLEGRSSRRGFLRKSALVGSAMVAAPGDFVLRPGTAYAAICNCNGSACQCGSQCCDGYTEFCCTMNGSNGCPPGTLYGGWWKADGSGFCGSGPRYYLDCNAPCGDCGCGPSGVCSGSCSGTPCGCANGSCANRKAGCTGFRYGQCNQDVACLGPIVCRVVTCALPWALDPSCSTTPRTDNNTRGHNAACLQADPGDLAGKLITVELAPGGFRVVGYVKAGAPNEVRLSVGTANFVDVVANKTADAVGQNDTNTSRRWFEGIVKTPAGPHVICAAVVDGNRLRSVGCEHVLAPARTPFGALEAAHPGPGLVRLIGWAIDPDTDGPVNVKISVDGEFVRTIKAKRLRRDISRRYNNTFSENHGFDVKIDAPDNSKMCVYAANRKAGKGLVLLGCATVDQRSGSPIGSLDSVSEVPGGVLVEGWALDPDVKGAIKVDIRVDGVTVTTVTARKKRRDVGRAHPGYGKKHGFSVVVPVTAGEHEICVRGRDTGPGRTRKLGCATITTSSASPTGGIDNVTVLSGRLQLSGWAIDPDVVGPVSVEAVVDGILVSTVVANIDRQDVADAFPQHGGAHGFWFDLPASPGSHEICITALDATGDAPVSLGCREVMVP